ncbi:MAG TPA: DNA cytosine methyltransferase [Bryobacteraceae bacterium]|nr:DNA cytosine methyltransferase [Bryobacteraceae bacterium]
MMTSVELFAGVGGLALGVSNAGFQHKAVIEIDDDARATIRENQRRGVHPVTGWALAEPGDVRRFDFASLGEDIDLLAGGVPCQPWSLGGKHRGYHDERNLFPDMVAAIRTLKPKAVLIENVKGLLRQSFSKYFDYITLMVRHPEVVRMDAEPWMAHRARLEQHHTSGRERGLEYKVLFRLLNAADYGVPQRRERVFIVGFRGDLGIEWSFPPPTHSLDALLSDQWVTGEYWDRHEVSKKERPRQPSSIRPRLERITSLLPLDPPWRTVRDAILGLPDPENGGSTSVMNHVFQPGAKPYPGHTGSPLDEPAKTLKAGDHGVPGGENMLRLPSGRVRYLTVRESARVQTFPDEFVFPGSWTETMRQLGNAVPVQLAEVIASDIRRCLAARAKRSPSRCEPNLSTTR